MNEEPYKKRLWKIKFHKDPTAEVVVLAEDAKAASDLIPEPEISRVLAHDDLPVHWREDALPYCDPRGPIEPEDDGMGVGDHLLWSEVWESHPHIRCGHHGGGFLTTEIRRRHGKIEMLLVGPDVPGEWEVWVTAEEIETMDEDAT